MNQNWNVIIFSKVYQAIRQVVGDNACIITSIAGAFCFCLCDDYIVKFTIHCDVSCDTEEERKRCQSLITALKAIVDEKAYAEACELVSISENDGNN